MTLNKCSDMSYMCVSINVFVQHDLVAYDQWVYQN